MADPYVGPVAKSSGTGNLPIVRIVVHCTVGADATNAMSTVNYFKSSAAGGSAHAVIDQDETLVCAYDNVICWHAPPNSHSLGVEMCCSLSDKGQGHWDDLDHVAMMKRTAKWTAEKCVKHNIPPRKLTVAQVRAGEKGVCGHVDVSDAFGQSSHWDPGPYFPWTLFMTYVKGYYDALVNSEEDDMPWTEVQLRAMIQAELEEFRPKARADVQSENEEYATRFWIASGGTGKALIDDVNKIQAELDRVPAEIWNTLMTDVYTPGTDDKLAASWLLTMTAVRAAERTVEMLLPTINTLTDKVNVLTEMVDGLVPPPNPPEEPPAEPLPLA